jgi:hypothetical protein
MISFKSYFKSIPLVYMIYGIVLYFISIMIRNVLMKNVSWYIGVLYWIILVIVQSISIIELSEHVKTETFLDRINSHVLGTIPGMDFVHMMMLGHVS